MSEGRGINATSFMSSLSDPLNRLSIKDFGSWLRNVLKIEFNFPGDEEASLKQFGTNFISVSEVNDNLNRTSEFPDFYIPPPSTTIRSRQATLRDPLA